MTHINGRIHSQPLRIAARERARAQIGVVADTFALAGISGQRFVYPSEGGRHAGSPEVVTVAEGETVAGMREIYSPVTCGRQQREGIREN